MDNIIRDGKACGITRSDVFTPWPRKDPVSIFIDNLLADYMAKHPGPTGYDGEPIAKVSHQFFPTGD